MTDKIIIRTNNKEYAIAVLKGDTVEKIAKKINKLLNKKNNGYENKNRSKA